MQTAANTPGTNKQYEKITPMASKEIKVIANQVGIFSLLNNRGVTQINPVTNITPSDK